IRSHVTYCCKAGFECQAGIGNGFERDLRCSLFQNIERITVAVPVSNMCVAVDEARQYRLCGKIDHVRAGRNSDVPSYFLYSRFLNQDSLIGEYRARVSVDETSGMDCSDLSGAGGD